VLEKGGKIMQAHSTFVVPVTKWLPERDNVQFVVEDLVKQKVSFGVARRKGTYSVWRKKMKDDPQDLVTGKPPVDFVEIYQEGIQLN
jgi:hypothetical protein